MKTIFEYDDFIGFLSSVTESRRSRNPKYSLRAFARDLELDPAHLSLILRGKKRLSERAGVRVAQRLGLNEKESQYFVELLLAHSRQRNPKLSDEDQAKLSQFFAQSEKLQEAALLDVVGDYNHVAVFSLVMMADGNLDLSRISKQLGIAESAVTKIVQKLVEAGFLMFDEKTNLYRADAPYNRYPNADSKSLALQRFHRSVISVAEKQIQDQPPAEREYQSAVFTFKKSDILKAKTLIRDFDLKFRSLANKADDHDSVYTLAIQFFKVGEN